MFGRRSRRPELISKDLEIGQKGRGTAMDNAEEK